MRAHRSGDGGHVLAHARLVVDEHDRNQQRIGPHRRRHALGFERARRLAADDRHLGSADVFQPSGRLEHRVVLDGRNHQVAAPPRAPALQRAAQPQVVRL